MKAPPVDSVQTAVKMVDTDSPEADGTFAWTSTTIVLVKVAAGDVSGLGYTYGPAACSAAVDDLLAPALHGCDPMNVPRVHLAMQQAVRNVGRPGVASCAMSAVDIALWDLKARLLDLPLHQLLGAVRDEVAVYGSGGFTTYSHERLRDQLTGWVQGEGIPRVKIKIGDADGTRAERDVERIRQARDVIGKEAELYVDANGGYTAKQAVRVLEEVEQAQVTWFEEPVSSDDLDGLALVRRMVDADVTAGEYGYDLPYFRRMLEAGAVDCLQVDVTRCGGITEWMRAAALAAAFGIEVSAHCAPHVHAAVAAAAPNTRHIEWFHDHVRIEDMLFDGTLDPSGGTITPVESRPGHGLELRDPGVFGATS